MYVVIRRIVETLVGVGMSESTSSDLNKEAVYWGQTIGKDYAKVWDSIDVIQESVTKSVTDFVDFNLAPQKPVDSSKLGGIMTAVLWVAGLWVPVMTQNWAYFWIFGIGGWVWFFGWLKFAASKDNKFASLRQSLIAIGVDTAVKVIEKRKQKAANYEPHERNGVNHFEPAGPMPEAHPFGVSHQGAEQLVQQWIRFLGEEDAEVTRFTADGGVDVESLHYIVQVKNYKGSVSVAEIRQLQGVASADGRKPLFFTSGTYTAEAIKFAAAVNMPLFIYNAEEGTLDAEGDLAEKLLVSGL